MQKGCSGPATPFDFLQPSQNLLALFRTRCNDGLYPPKQSIRNVSSRICKTAARSDRACASYIESRHRTMEPFKGELTGWLRKRKRLDSRLNLAINEDLAITCLSAKARRQIDHGPNCSIVKSSFEPDPTERGVTLSNADAKSKLMSMLVPFGGETHNVIAHFNGHAHGAQRRIGTR